jgi:hypothetical protein
MPDFQHDFLWKTGIDAFFTILSLFQCQRGIPLFLDIQPQMALFLIGCSLSAYAIRWLSTCALTLVSLSAALSKMLMCVNFNRTRQLFSYISMEKESHSLLFAAVRIRGCNHGSSVYMGTSLRTKNHCDGSFICGLHQHDFVLEHWVED